MGLGLGLGARAKARASSDCDTCASNRVCPVSSLRPESNSRKVSCSSEARGSIARRAPSKGEPHAPCAAHLGGTGVQA